MYQILMFLSMILSFMFMKMNHPMSMGLILLIQTLLISLMSGMMTFSYWFSYILFLIMIGGMLVLFIYMTSLASNEAFNWKINNFLLMMSIIITLMSVSYFYFDSFMLLIKNFETMPISSLILNENLFNLIKLYNNPTMNITLMLINYLLLTLIVIVKITNIKQGPLRQMS